MVLTVSLLYGPLLYTKVETMADGPLTVCGIASINWDYPDDSPYLGSVISADWRTRPQ